MSTESKPWVGITITVVVGLFVTIVGGVVAWHLTEGMRTSQADGRSVDPAPSASEALPSAPPDTGTTETQPEPAAVEQAFTPVALTTAEQVGGDRCHVPGNTGAPWENEIAPIAGVPYVAGLSCRMAHKMSAGSIEFLVPAGATHLTTVAGQRDDAENTTAVVRFEAIDAVSGEVLAVHELPYGQARSIDVPVDGRVRVALKASMLSFVDDPWSAAVRPAFAEPTFR